MATRQKIAELLALATVQCPVGAPDKDSRGVVLAAWLDMFAAVDDDVLATAVKAHALDPDRGRFFPVASDLARHLPRPMQLPELADADADAWGRILAAGWYDTGPHDLDDVQRAAWSHVGGRWATSGRGDAEASSPEIASASRRKRFLAYCSTRRQAQLRPLLPPPDPSRAIPDVHGATVLRGILGGSDPHADARARILDAERTRREGRAG